MGPLLPTISCPKISLVSSKVSACIDCFLPIVQVILTKCIDCLLVHLSKETKFGLAVVRPRPVHPSHLDETVNANLCTLIVASSTDRGKSVSQCEAFFLINPAWSCSNRIPFLITRASFFSSQCTVMHPNYQCPLVCQSTAIAFLLRATQDPHCFKPSYDFRV